MCIVNVVDASSLARGLYLTTELIELGRPMVIALNMIDVADRHGQHIDAYRLSQELGCPVVPIIASRGDGIAALKDAIFSAAAPTATLAGLEDPTTRYRFIDSVLEACMQTTPIRRTITDRIDALVLNRFWRFPCFCWSCT